ncbi:hypothetical protein BHE97_00905 [Aeromicrobium sp. PE09-221]|uniref:hypothetical protein n=1 Tax=Aeromicrobium sp. PE09-221 TaxID=1898043 RepID=UPI0007623DCB|nr:hypothetical protein [Aeromicrobium sp. PE09-221]KWU53052.1 hypothetical protein AWX17_27440 [Priestia megaterium]OUZ12800.1 hypothetical protein BHE97_00905 [Aeromicrobium sp. PE09-221]
MITLNDTDQMPATIDSDLFDSLSTPATPATPAARHEARGEVNAMKFRERRRRERDLVERELDREIVIEAVRRSRAVQRSVYEQIYRARLMR